jgi:DNA/RNA endonuclease YhcR with UshA esterase domain
MRLCAAVFALIVTSAFADESAKPLTPADAAKKVNEKCTVEMEVKSVGMGKGGKVGFLNSEEDYKSDKNFTIFLAEKAIEQLKAPKVDDLATRFKGKTVRVTGTVKLYHERPEIVVEDPEKDVKIVEKK